MASQAAAQSSGLGRCRASLTAAAIRSGRSLMTSRHCSSSDARRRNTSRCPWGSRRPAASEPPVRESSGADSRVRRPGLPTPLRSLSWQGIETLPAVAHSWSTRRVEYALITVGYTNCQRQIPRGGSAAWNGRSERTPPEEGHRTGAVQARPVVLECGDSSPLSDERNWSAAIIATFARDVASSEAGPYRLPSREGSGENGGAP